MLDRVTAPWSEEQVKSLNAYQQDDHVHEFTSIKGITLIATRDGWVECEGGPVVQRWAHAFMADWSWRQPW